MKHIKSFNNYSVNEEWFGYESKETKAKKEALSKLFDELNAKLVKKVNKEKAMKRAEEEDNFNGKFVIDRGILQYNSKSSNPLQDSTGGTTI
jgi:hypothetical protein